MLYSSQHLVAGHDHRCMQHTKLRRFAHVKLAHSDPTCRRELASLLIGGDNWRRHYRPPRLKRKFVLSVVESSVFGMATGV